MSATRVLPTRDGYDRWAATYDTMGNWLLALEEPEVERALGEVAGRDIVDVGTGTGRHAIRLAQAGARVTGLDFSHEMLARARAKEGAKRVRWLVHDVSTALPFADRSFDGVLSALVLEHIEVGRLGFFFAELGRVCRDPGRIVVTAMHPAMFLKGLSAKFHDGAEEIRPRSYDATISDYVMAAIDAGLRIERLSERAIDDDFADRFEAARKFLGWPALFVITLRPHALLMSGGSPSPE